MKPSRLWSALNPSTTLIVASAAAMLAGLGTNALAGKPVVSFCGNGTVESQKGEQCDGSNLSAKTCQTQGFPEGGALACDSSCRFDTSGCFQCGNGVVEPGEQCDGTHIGNDTCESLGFETGNLSCSSTCELDSSSCGCVSAALPATGQRTTYAHKDDGNFQSGATLSYADNGDGTVTDNNTGLVWEKKTNRDGNNDASNLHDADNCYPWAGTCSGGEGGLCGTDADCLPGNTCDAEDCQGATGLTVFQWVDALNVTTFAAHDDWRVPNVKELQSIVDYGRSDPAIDPMIGPTRGSVYWSATTIMVDPTRAWIVSFGTGHVTTVDKATTKLFGRAVRGGAR